MFESFYVNLVTLLVPYGVIKKNQLTEPMMVPIPKKIGKILYFNHNQSLSSVGRASALHAECRGFESLRDYNKIGDVAQGQSK